MAFPAPTALRPGKRNRRNSPDLPASNDLVHHSARIAQYWLATTDRQFVQVTEHKATTNIEVRVTVLPFRMFEVTEVATILGTQVGIGSDIERMRPRIRREEGKSAGEALLGT